MGRATTTEQMGNLMGAVGTIHQMIEAAARVRPSAPALAAPGAEAMTRKDLADQASYVRDCLAALGLNANSRVAMVLPNDAVLAACFLTVAAAASCAPLNAAYQAEELGALLKDLRADALLVDEALETPARNEAQRLGIPIILVRRRPGGVAGSFELVGESGEALKAGVVSPLNKDAAPGGDDVALLLHTSGTTSRPKIVPLKHANLLASARNITECYRLGADDVCLNVMPLFHIHGLVAGLLVPLWSGGTTVCPPAFTADGFFAWLDAFSPTWYTAVPTMHQAVLRRAPSFKEIVEANRLRFIRSSSAAIPETIAADIEQLFGAPLLEAYSMTEAAHQMTSNPLPPAARKARSVGLPMGVDVAILDEAGKELEQGRIGEVAVRGPTVITAYERNETANEAAFVNGWFRTGDQGVLDSDGYLTLTGRLKELIIRGGQNIAPVEVDQALLAHPAVAQAVCFAVPHGSLGEDIAAAVVLKEGHQIGDAELRRHVAGRLAEFKVPRRIVFLEELPKGPTGKLQRIGLAETLGLGAEIERNISAEDEDISGYERQVADIWAAELGLERVGLDEDYFNLGGDSLQAIEIFLKLEELLGKPLPPTILFEASTVREMAQRIRLDVEADCLVPIRPSDEGPAFFCVHPVSGEVIGFSSIVRHLNEKCAFYGLQPVGRDGKSRPLTSIEDMAHHYIEEIRSVQPAGPYYLGGLSFGGLVAYEMAQRLQAEGEEIALLGLMDTHYPYKPDEVGFGQRIVSWLATHQKRWAELPRGKRRQYIRLRLRHIFRLFINKLPRKVNEFRAGGDPEKVISVDRRIRYANTIASENYTPRPYAGGVTYFLAERSASEPKIVHERWRDLITGPFNVRPISGRHFNLIDEPQVQGLADALDAAFRAVQDHAGSE